MSGTTQAAVKRALKAAQAAQAAQAKAQAQAEQALTPLLSRRDTLKAQMDALKAELTTVNEHIKATQAVLPKRRTQAHKVHANANNSQAQDARLTAAYESIPVGALEPYASDTKAQKAVNAGIDAALDGQTLKTDRYANPLRQQAYELGFAAGASQAAQG